MSRRNLVFIMSDQQRRDSMGCYGSGWAQTPNLDALASSGYLFENAYVTQPVCTPARASIMTGLYPHTAGPVVNKLPLSPDVPVLAEMVSDEYVCGYMGKWHLGDDVIKQHGFDVWTSTEDYHRGFYTRREHRRVLSDYHHHLVANGFEPDSEVAGDMTFSPDARARLPEEFQMASFLAERAEQFIDDHGDRPFVLYVSTFEPHSPYDGPFDGQYDPDLLPVGPAFLKRPEGAALVNRVRADYFMQYLHGGDITGDPYMRDTLAPGHDLSTEAGWRRLRAQYYGNVTLVDRMVGRITSALERAGVADDTAVVFTTEHGDMLGDHGMLEKRSFYEESSRVPLSDASAVAVVRAAFGGWQCGARRPRAHASRPPRRVSTQPARRQEPGPGTAGRGDAGRERCLHRVERHKPHAAGQVPGQRCDQSNAGASLIDPWCRTGGS